MGHDHSHSGHSHDHTAGASTRMLGWALALTSTYLVVQVIGGIAFNSLALLSDAAHMMTDAAALLIALLAIKIGSRPADERRTFGYRRLEILAAAFNAILLFLVAIYIFIEAIERFRDPPPVQSWGMLAVAAIGLVVNLVSMRLLMSGKEASLNVKGAYLEVWADMIGSVGVILAALAIRFTGWAWIDPLVAVAIGLWVLPRAWVLLRDTMNVLLEGVPRGLALGNIRASIAAVEGVAGLHDLHVWSTGNGEVSCTVHIMLKDPAQADIVRRSVAGMLHDTWAIEHTTIQTEAEGSECGEEEVHA